MAGIKLLPCPWCGSAIRLTPMDMPWADGTPAWSIWHVDTTKALERKCPMEMGSYDTEAEAIEAWNTRAAYEMEGFFYLPKPKEPIVEVTETTNAWDGTKVRTDVFYQVQKQAIVNWAKELDEHIIKRICEVWDTRAERTCHNISEDGFLCSVCSFGDFSSFKFEPHYCPSCGAKVVSDFVTCKCGEDIERHDRIQTCPSCGRKVMA